jgi:hypothetical protein
LPPGIHQAFRFGVVDEVKLPLVAGELVALPLVAEVLFDGRLNALAHAPHLGYFGGVGRELGGAERLLILGHSQRVHLAIRH